MVRHRREDGAVSDHRKRGSRWLRLAPLAAVVAVLAQAPATAHAGATVQSFDADGVGTAYDDDAPAPTDNPPPVELLPGGPTGSGRFMRLAPAVAGTPVANSIAFDATHAAPATGVVADFDIRMTPGRAVGRGATGRADGLGFALLSAARYGPSGEVVPTLPPTAAEDPNFTGSLGIGFDLFRSNAFDGDTFEFPPDIGNDNVAARFSNSVSVHFDRMRADGTIAPWSIHQRDVSHVTDLASGSWIHVRVIVESTTETTGRVSVVLTCGETAVTVVDRLPVALLKPYASRVWFGARSGGWSAHSDLDNVHVQFLEGHQSVVSLGATAFEAGEGSGGATFTLTRSGSTGSSVTAQLGSEDDGATAGADYTPPPSTVTFAANETVKTVSIPLTDDAITEGDEGLVVKLGAVGGGVVGGPSQARVAIKDDETARERGQWSAPRCLPVVAVHASMLPTGDVLLWDRFAKARVWRPAAGAVSTPHQPHHEIFCSGHSLLADGRLLVTGGHAHPDGSSMADGIGLETATCFDPKTGAWTDAPHMNAGRWYPTNTTLHDGSVLVTSGSFDVPYRKNTLPQVWRPGTQPCGSWRDLTNADSELPLGVELYPWMFLAPDGRVFKAGPDRRTWFLDPAGAGSWQEGPQSGRELRKYGSAVLYDVGRILVVGGSTLTPGGADEPATATAERIDLLAGSGWQPAGAMKFARRHPGTAVLPDGTVLVTGGTSGAEFNDEAAAVREAELWDPASGAWKELSAARVGRTYHSTAMLLADGRVLVAGGGHGASASQQHGEIELFSPPYLFKGQRPVISFAPKVAHLGQSIVVGTAQGPMIARAALVRLPSVTHSFDQNMRFVPVTVAPTLGGVEVSLPASANVAPPGHYMLFIVTGNGVPSVASIVRLTPPPPPLQVTPVSPPPEPKPVPPFVPPRPYVAPPVAPPAKPRPSRPRITGKPLKRRVAADGTVTLALKIHCPGRGPKCRATVRAKHPARASGRKVGSATMKVKAATHASARFRLTSMARRKLRRARKLVLRVTISVARRGARTVSRTAKVTVKARSARRPTVSAR